jgi:myosin-crossreactive antigen
MAVPHEVLWKVGLLPEVKKPFDDEWSFGTQFLMDYIPDAFKDFTGKSYNLSFDAPWNIVFQIQHQNGFWKDVNFPKSHPYNLSATCSSPFNKGLLYGKRFMECTPTEAKHEILYQLGITSEDERQHLATHANIDSVYLKYTEDWEQYAHFETSSLGILQDNGKRWVNLSQIYVRSAQDKEVLVTTATKGVFLAGEVVNVPGKWKIPTMEQAAMSGKQAAQEIFKFCNIKRSVNMNYSILESTSGFKLMEGILAGLTGIAKLIPHSKDPKN